MSETTTTRQGFNRFLNLIEIKPTGGSKSTDNNRKSQAINDKPLILIQWYGNGMLYHITQNTITTHRH